MKIKLTQLSFEKQEETKIIAILSLRTPDGNLLFEQGIEPKDIAQHLVGINVGRIPSKGYVKTIEKICNNLLQNNKVSETK